MSEFDFVRAWKELAYPSFTRLYHQQEWARKLVNAVQANVEKIHQQENLECNWPFTGDASKELVGSMESAGLAALAYLSHVYYFFVHWMPGKQSFEDLVVYEAARRLAGECGAHWMLANLMDQFIAKRLGISRRRMDDKGEKELILGSFTDVIGRHKYRTTWFITVHEGALNLVHDSKDLLFRKSLGWASKEAVEKIKELAEPFVSQKEVIGAESILRRLAEEMRSWSIEVDSQLPWAQQTDVGQWLNVGTLFVK